ncbi:MAG: hypothetical protein Q7J16_12815 [Candidatus Cloacimonadales bacterium]|nr:hypothetical protein [Candidatus Cloacimonadales bacterium]
MRRSLFVLIMFWGIVGNMLGKTSVICTHNPSALAGTVLVGTALAFFINNMLTKVIKSRNKVGSFFINIGMLVVWALCCYGTCYLIRLIFF